MNKQKLIERNQQEKLGKHYLKKAVDFALERSFGKSYEFIKEGLDILTCDCNDGWRDAYKNSKQNLFCDIEIKHHVHHEYFFVKAFILSYEDTKQALYIALEAIDTYIKSCPDEFGYYVKGKILHSLGEHKEGLQEYFLAQEINNGSRIEYRIGLSKENYLKERGLEDLFVSFSKNPSSICCARTLQKYMKARGLKLALDENETNPLLLSFNDSENEWEFDQLYENYLNNEVLDEDLLFGQEETKPCIEKFIGVVNNNSRVFASEQPAIQIEQFVDYTDSNLNIQKDTSYCSACSESPCICSDIEAARAIKDW